MSIVFRLLGSFSQIAPMNRGLSRRPLRHPALVALILALSFGRSSLADVNQWTFRGPVGGAVHTVAIHPEDPSLVYAGTDDGVVRSTDGGETWAPSGALIDDVLTLEIDPVTPSRLYASVFGVLYRSFDGGETWGDSRSLGNTVNHILTLAIDPVEPSNLYAGLGLGRFASTTDGGDTWNFGPSFGSVHAIEVDPTTPTTLYLVGSDQVYRSLDSGATWLPVLAVPFGAKDLALAATSPTTLFLTVASSSELRRSVDGGTTWTTIDHGLTGDELLTVETDPTEPATVFLGTSSGTAKSTDGGATWTRTSDGLYVAVGALAIDPQSPAKVYAGAQAGGLHRSLDGGASWTLSVEGFPRLSTLVLAVDALDGNNLYAATLDLVYRSQDGGASWAPMNVGLEPGEDTENGPFPVALEIDPQDPSNLFLAQLSFIGNSETGVSRSSDEGKTWETSIILESNTDLDMDPRDPATLYASHRFGVSRTIDRGEAWSFALGGQRFASVVVSESIPATLFANASDTNDVFRSSDGVNWVDVTASMPGEGARIVAIDPTSSSVIYAVDGSDIFRSSDGGSTWTTISNGLPRGTSPGGFVVNGIAVDPTAPETLYISTGKTVFRSVDAGARWAPLSYGLPDTLVRTPVIDPTNPRRLWAGTAEGLYVLELDPPLGLQEDRFEVEIEWLDGAGVGGLGTIATRQLETTGQVALASPDSTVVEFFGPDNWELLVKVLDGRSFNDHFWASLAAATDVAFSASITDTSCGATWTFSSPLGETSPAVLDDRAFPGCEAPVPASCVASEDTLCLGEDGRFEVRFTWTDFQGVSGVGKQVFLDETQPTDSGLYYLFTENNWEMLVKVLDGCAINDRFWVFAAATTDVEYRLRVTDTATGVVQEYLNPLGQASDAVTDTDAFSGCP